jgi:2'-5' RNA ligase
MKVINNINPIRDGLRANEQARLATAQGLELKNIQQYGYRSVGELFAPHMTLTRFLTPEHIDIPDLPDISTFDSIFERIAIFEMGDNGTCVRKIAEFNLNR